MKVEALDAGADDYVTKPFSINELLARVRAGLRRASTPAAEPELQEIKVGDFHIDFSTRAVTVRGREVRLTPKEFDLLTYLAKHPGKVLTHRVLLGAVWGGNSTEQPEYLRVFMNHFAQEARARNCGPAVHPHTEAVGRLTASSPVKRQPAFQRAQRDSA